MEALGIAEACAFALGSYGAEPHAGNEQLVDALADEPRLHPVWVLGPHQCGEFPEPRRLAQELARNGVRMVRIPCGALTMQKRLDLVLFRDVFAALAPCRVPIMIDCLDSLDQVSTGELETLLGEWTGCPLILTFPKLEQHDRMFYYLWEKFDHFYVEISGYQTLGAIEEVTKRFGSNRLVYGSKYPHFTPLQTMLQVIYSDVAADVKRDLAGNTVRRLLEEVTY
jgi:predicted TIM-barrel fold metal-dependent hydrolase